MFEFAFRGVQICALSLLLGLLGCGGGSEFSTVPVSGKVTFEGKPMQGGGSIRLVPLAKEGGKPAGGVIKPDGSFTLATYDHENPDGAIPGEHRVEITQNAILEPAQYEAVPENAGEEFEPKLLKEEVAVPSEDRIPASYGGAESPLRVTVESGQEPLMIQLKADGT